MGLQHTIKSVVSKQVSERLPWWESTALWSCISIGIGVVCGVVAAMVADLRWMLILAALFFWLAGFLATRNVRVGRVRWLIRAGICALVVGILWCLSVVLYHPVSPSNVARLPSAKEFAAEVAKQIPRQNSNLRPSASTFTEKQIQDIAKKLLPQEAPLLQRAVEDVTSCDSFLESYYKRLEEAEARIKVHNSRPYAPDDPSKTLYAMRTREMLHHETMQLFNQVYKQEFAEIHRLLATKVPEVVTPNTDYEDPQNTGVVLGICSDLRQMTEAFIKRQYSEGHANNEEAKKYFKMLHPAIGR